MTDKALRRKNQMIALDALLVLVEVRSFLAVKAAEANRRARLERAGLPSR